MHTAPPKSGPVPIEVVDTTATEHDDATGEPRLRAVPTAAAPAGLRPVPTDDQPIRILHVITRLIVGGAMENTLLTVYGQQRDPRFDVTLFAGIDLGPEGNLHDEARRHGTHLVLSPHLTRNIHPWRDVRALHELVRFMRAGRYHVVHTHSSKGGIVGRLAARLAGVPLIVHTLHGLVFHDYQSSWRNRFYIGMKKLCAPFTDQYISVCEATRRGALAAGIGSAERNETIFSGMELEPFLSATGRIPVETARRRFGLPTGVPVVGKIARLFHLKGHEQFIDMATRLHRERPDVHFLVVGGGLLENELKAETRARGIDQVVHFAGLLRPEEIPEALVAMDVVVHASLREGIARVLPQAYAVGRPAVVFDLDGAPEVVEDGRSGFVLPPGDTAGMAERVRELVDDPERRRAFAAHGRAFVEREFPAARMVERINALYERHLLAQGLMRQPDDGDATS
ncbi:MAG: glycosyltransferase family 4 protein [Candidatus Eiseniibacteriota bacterium]